LFPAAASVFRKVSPTEHVVGSVVPVLDGFVEDAAEKSTFLDWVTKSTRVCAVAAIMAAANSATAALPRRSAGP